MATDDDVKIYLDACCYIDLVQHQNDFPIDEGRNNHIWYCHRFLDAARAKDIEVYGSTLLIAECTAVRDEKREKIINDDVKSSFKAILLSGNPVIPVQPMPKILDIARGLSWDHGLRMGTLDAIHVATAVMLKCDAFVTTDKSLAEKINNLKHKFHISAGTADLFKEHLPTKYRQNILELKGKK